MHGIVPTQTPEEREHHRYLSEVEVRRGRAAELQAELASLNLTLVRLPQMVAGLHFVAFACLMRHKLGLLPGSSP